MGTLGDRIGRRRLLMIGAGAFGVASVLAAFSPTATLLIVSRGFLGLAAATLAPSTLSLIRNMFLDGRERSLAVGIWVSGFSAGAAIGPLIGGFLLDHFWWGSVFLLAVPVMALLLLLAPRLLPEFRDPDPGRLDVASAALSLVAVLATIYAVKRLAEAGFQAGLLGILALAAVCGALFVMRQRRVADPLINLDLFASPAFGGALAINVLTLFSAFGLFLLVALQLQLVLGMTPLQAGLWSLPSAAALIVGSLLAPVLVRHLPPATIMVGGFAVAIAGCLMLTLIAPGDGPVLLVAGATLLSLGTAPIGPLTTEMVLTVAPPARAGAASAVSETSFELGGALGIAVLGSVATAVYRMTMATGLPPGLGPAAATAAQGTLGGAVLVAQELVPEAGEALMATARSAFTGALAVTAFVAGAVLVAAAILAVTLLRRPAPPA